MKKYNYNFTVITSGGCNAKCDFCTDPMNYKPSSDYIQNFIGLFINNQLPSMFDQISISGGEPTISPDLSTLLNIVSATKRFKKVVLTTNGTNLLPLVDVVGTHVDHVNVSRHGVGYENNVKVFKNKQIINDKDLKESAEKLAKYGVDVNLNYVYSEKDKLTKQDVSDYIKYAKDVSATKVTFRYDQNLNTLEETYLEKLFSDYHSVEEGGCPVCRSKTILFEGMYVTFKSSFAEPGNTVGELYELIYHPSGKLTTDWEGKKEYIVETPAYAIKLQSRPEPVHYGSGGCGSGGCGR